MFWEYLHPESLHWCEEAVPPLRRRPDSAELSCIANKPLSFCHLEPFFSSEGDEDR